MAGDDSSVGKILEEHLTKQARELAMLKAEAAEHDLKAARAQIEALASEYSIRPDEYEQWLPPPIAIKMLEPILPGLR